MLLGLMCRYKNDDDLSFFQLRPLPSFTRLLSLVCIIYRDTSERDHSLFYINFVIDWHSFLQRRRHLRCNLKLTSSPIKKTSAESSTGLLLGLTGSPIHPELFESPPCVLVSQLQSTLPCRVPRNRS